MKFPKRPPTRAELMGQLSSERLFQIVSVVTEPTVSGKYLHWDDLRHRKPPEGLSLLEWWFGLRFRRTADKSIPLLDLESSAFSFRVIDLIQESLHKIDLLAGGAVHVPDPVTNPETKTKYLVRSLMEEAITSSQLEGAAT